MATCITSSWSNLAPQARVTVWVDSETGSTAKLGWKLEYIAVEAASTSTSKSFTVKVAGQVVGSGSYNIDGKVGVNQITSGYVEVDKTTSAQTIAFSVSFAFNLTWSGVYGGTKSASGSISVAAITSYKITYDANGGTAAPSAQTKLHGISVLLSSAKPFRNGYTFKNWLSTAQNQAYNPGTYYGHDESTTMVAQWNATTYTVAYNANGGLGAPSAQTKTHGVALTLSSVKPERAGYIFEGWATSASATMSAYKPGASYTANAAVTLYAVWSLSYVQPRISNVQASRCDASGNKTDSGTYAALSFNWAADNSASVIVTAQVNSQELTLCTKYDAGTSGLVSGVFGDGQISADASCNIQITVSDSSGKTSITTTLQGQSFAIDFLAGGKGVAFGKPAEKQNTIDSAWNLDMNGNTITNYGYAPEVFSSENEAVDRILQRVYAAMDASTKKEIVLKLSENDSLPVGGTWFVTICKSNDNYGTIHAVRYYAKKSPNCAEYRRSVYGGTWSDWEKMISASDAWPIGSIYIAYNAFDPAELFGGTWTRIEGRMLFGCAASGTIGATGTHTTGSGSSSLPYVNVAIWRRTA